MSETRTNDQYDLMALADALGAFRRATRLHEVGPLIADKMLSMLEAASVDVTIHHSEIGPLNFKSGAPAMQASGTTLSAALAWRDGKTLGQIVVRGARPSSKPVFRLLTEAASIAIEANCLSEEAMRAKQLRNAAVRAGQMKDDFLAKLSHELRTPLNVIQGNTELLGLEGIGPAQFAASLDAIQRNARIQAQLISDLLDFSRITSGRLQLRAKTVDVNESIYQAAEPLLAAAQAKSVEMSLDLGEVPTVAGDPVRLTQIFSNLLTNALKFTPRGGAIQVSTAEVAGRVEIRVRDNGHGMDEGVLAGVFDRFLLEGENAKQPITRLKSGLGLGLAIAKHLTLMHGGQINAASEGLGKGSLFTVILPPGKIEEKAFPSQTPAKTANGNGLSGLSLLVVDDQEDTQEMLKSLLRRMGAEVTTMGSAEEALDLLRGKTFDAIVSDIGMPDVDGFTFLRCVRQLPGPSKDTPAVALTAFARPEDRSMAFAAGFQAHIAKPVDTSALVEALTSLVHKG